MGPGSPGMDGCACYPGQTQQEQHYLTWGKGLGSALAQTWTSGQWVIGFDRGKWVLELEEDSKVTNWL
jgi:hypothetical protein